MKTKTIIRAALLVAVLTSSAQADTQIDVTGATAFRATLLQAVYNAYASVTGAITNGNFATFNLAYDFTGNNSATFLSSNRITFQGAYPGISGTTVIRCSFNGSVEGLKAIATTNEPANFLTSLAIANTGTYQGGATAPTENARPKFSFSDVLQQNTPVTNSLNPLDPQVCVVTYVPLANNGAPSNFSNLTRQQLKALVGSGTQPVSLFTGNTNDLRNVYMVGDNDGSGTRTDYLLESGYGVANSVQQFVPLFSTNGTNTSSGTNGYGGANAGQITALTLVPGNGQGAGLVSNSAYVSGTNKIRLNTNSPNYRYVYSGNLITGTGIATNTTITDIDPANGTITLSKSTTNSGSTRVTINGAIPYNTGSTNYASTSWGTTSVGNGGYNSSSSLAALFTYRSTNVSIWDGLDSVAAATDLNIILVTWLNTSDARSATETDTLARVLSWNGIKIMPIATSASYNSSGFSQTDYNKITTGAYSGWSYENLYYWGTLDNDMTTFDTTLRGSGVGSINAALGTTANGLPLSDMNCSRPLDGGPISGTLN